MADNKMIYMPLGSAGYSAIVGRDSYMPEGRPTYKDYMFLASKIKMRAQNMITFERLEQVLNSGNADTAARLLAEEMEQVAALSVPLTAEAHWGRNWLEAKG